MALIVAKAGCFKYLLLLARAILLVYFFTISIIYPLLLTNVTYSYCKWISITPSYNPILAVYFTHLIQIWIYFNQVAILSIENKS